MRCASPGELRRRRTDAHREEVLATLATVSDFSYAWGIIDAYTPVLQAQVLTPNMAE